MDNRTKDFLWVIVGILLVFASGLMSYGLMRLSIPRSDVYIVVRDTIYVEPSEWTKMIEALIEVESEGNPSAINDNTDAVGLLQLTPIYVDEVNRLCKSDKFAYNDRYDAQKSIEMFLIYQSHKNPNKDIEKAIRLHNPRAGEWYKARVMKNM